MLINGKVFSPRRYSSGELKLVKSDLNSYVKNNYVEILFENDFSVFELLLVIEYYKKLGVKTDLILSYLPYQRMDHTGRDELDTLNYVADLFNSQKLNKITICEPHCEIDSFDNSQKLSYVDSVIKNVFEEIGFDEKNDYIVLTDKGGYKRYGHLGQNKTYFNKERNINTGLIVKQEIVNSIEKGRKVLIVDDIISTGDTIVNIVKYLSKKGIKDIYILSGHIENNKYNKRLEKAKNVKKIFSTNSLKKQESKKLKLFDIRRIIYK